MNAAALVRRRVFISASVRLCHAAGEFTLTAALIMSGYAIIMMNMGSPVLYFRATTFLSGLFSQ